MQPSSRGRFRCSANTLSAKAAYLAAFVRLWVPMRAGSVCRLLRTGQLRMRHRKRQSPEFVVCFSFLLMLVFGKAGWSRPAKAPAEQAGTIVAIADVHGDFDDFVAILQRTGL